jgi:AcrR family transcriptional regulator
LTVDDVREDHAAVTTASARTPQGERSRLMRQRLLEATVDCLVEHGWSGTSTTLVSQRAGVSRGAQLHHYPTRNDLVLAAVEHLGAGREEELRAQVAALPERPTRTREVLDVLADHFTGPLSVAAAEVWMGARTDRRLHEAVAAVEARVDRNAQRRTAEALGLDEPLAGARELVQATLDLVRGLCLAGTLTDDAVRRSRILDRWAEVLDGELLRSSDDGQARARRADD